MPREYYPEHKIIGDSLPTTIGLCPRCQAGLVRDLTPYDMGHHCPKCGNDEPGVLYRKVEGETHG